MQADFIAECFDEDGTPNGFYREVEQVAVLNGDGKELGSFCTADGLDVFLVESGLTEFKIVGLRLVGEARNDLYGRYVVESKK